MYRIGGDKHKFLFSTTFWSGISDCNFGKIIVHDFVSPDRPEPMGMDVFDTITGIKLWSRPDLVFQYFIDGEKALAVLKNSESFHYELVDMASGKTLVNYENGENTPDILSAESVEKSQNQLSIYREGEEDFEHVQKFIFQNQGKSISGLAEYLENDRLIVISYYIRASNGFVNECAIFDVSGKLVAKETLAAKTEQLALNAFMAHRQSIVLLKERKEVIFYEY